MSDIQHESMQRQNANEPVPRTVQAIATLNDAEGRSRHTTALRGLLTRVGDTCKKPVKRALHVRDTTALIRMSDAAAQKVDSLIAAGVFKTRGEAATFLFEEGIRASDAMFRRVSRQLDEIETLRTELRNGHASQFN